MAYVSNQKKALESLKRIIDMRLEALDGLRFSLLLCKRRDDARYKRASTADLWSGIRYARRKIGTHPRPW